MLARDSVGRHLLSQLVKFSHPQGRVCSVITMSTATSNCTVAATAAPIVSALTVLKVMRQALTSDSGYTSNTSAGTAAIAFCSVWVVGIWRRKNNWHLRDPIDVHDLTFRIVGNSPLPYHLDIDKCQ